MKVKPDQIWVRKTGMRIRIEETSGRLIKATRLTTEDGQPREDEPVIGAWLVHPDYFFTGGVYALESE